MKNITKLGLTTLACLVLSACGSSGGSNNATNNQPAASNQQPATNTQQPAANNQSTTNQQTATNTTSTAASNATGGVVIISGEDNNVSATKKALTDASQFKTQIIVDGKPITIGYSGIYSGGWANINNVHTCCGKYTDVRFGHVESESEQDNDYFYYNGNVTKAMPTSGSANYNGDFVLSFDDVAYPSLDEATDGEDVTGKAAFSVDFGNKTLSGSLTEQNIAPVNIQATLDGNSFNGTASSGSFSTSATVEGKFFGEKAKELGGIFLDKSNTWSGAFGAAQ